MTELKEARKQEMKPHSTFDVDGDGVVSSTDFYLSNRFDENGDGVLDDEERHELRRRMVDETVSKYRKLPRSTGAEAEEMIKAFTKNLDKTVDDPNFIARCDTRRSRPLRTHLLPHIRTPKHTRALRGAVDASCAQDRRRMTASVRELAGTTNC